MHVRASAALALLAALVAGCRGGAPEAGRPVRPALPTSGADVVARMHARWDGRWFRTLVFTQQNTRWARDGKEDASTWLEWLQAPGRLRIEFLPVARTGTAATTSRIADNGALYVDGKVVTIQNGAPVRTTEQLNILLVLTADVHAQPVVESVKQLTTLGVDLTIVRRDTFETRPVWVVGAGKDDLRATQFWVDEQRWTTVRVVERTPGVQGRPATSTEYQLRDVRDVGGVPIAHEITFVRDGQRIFRERYTDVQTNVTLDAALFDPARWKTARR